MEFCLKTESKATYCSKSIAMLQFSKPEEIQSKLCLSTHFSKARPPNVSKSIPVEFD